MLSSLLDEKTEIPISDLMKIKPNELLKKMSSRGWVFPEIHKIKINSCEKKILKENLNINETNYNFLIEGISTILLKSFKLFSELKSYNIDYKIYILIFFSLNMKNIKNLYRYIAIKWNRLKNKYKDLENVPDEINFSFDDIYNNISKFSLEDIQEKFLDNILKFTLNNKIYIIFIINVMQEYLCPL